MKSCTKCNLKKKGLKLYAYVEMGILKAQNMCQDCKIKLADISIPIMKITKEEMSSPKCMITKMDKKILSENRRKKIDKK